jgi:pyrroline-5-carboxylate reductase
MSVIPFESKAIRLGILGFGKMGQALAHGLYQTDWIRIVGVSTGTGKLTHHDVSVFKSRELVQRCQILVLAVKTDQAVSVLKEIAPFLTSEHLLISIVTGVEIAEIEFWAGSQAAIVRAIPNSPCLIGRGMTVCSLGSSVSSQQQEWVKSIFEVLGEVSFLPESQMSAIMGLSGCGPGYAYAFIDALIDAGVHLGLSRAVARQLAAQTLKGASEMVLKSTEHVASLKDSVATPGGCMVDGLLELEQGRFKLTLMRAVFAAAACSQKLHVRESE